MHSFCRSIVQLEALFASIQTLRSNLRPAERLWVRHKSASWVKPRMLFFFWMCLNACYRICFWMRLCIFSTCAFYLLYNHRWQVQQAKLVAQRAPSALTPWAEVCYHCCSRVEIDERWPERRQMQVTWCLMHKEPKRVGNRKQFIKWIQSQGLVLPYYVYKGGGLATLGVGASLGRGGFQCRFVKKQDMCIWSSARLFA